MSFQKTAGKNDIQEQFLLTGDFVECLVFWGLADFGHTINLEKYFLLLFSYFWRSVVHLSFLTLDLLATVVLWLFAVAACRGIALSAAINMLITKIMLKKMANPFK